MITRLYLMNWKNHKELDLNFKKGVNFIIGPNGSGKTSVLEGIMFGFAAGVRKKKDKKVFKKIGTTDTKLILELSHGAENRVIERSFNGKLTSKLNGSYIRNFDVFKDIVDLLKTNQSFFENIIFSSEGENYEFLKMKAVNFRNYVEELINLGRTKDFKNVVSNIKQFYDNQNEKLKRKSKILGESKIQKKYGDIDELKSKKRDLKLSIESIDTQIKQKDQALQELKRSIIKIEQKRKEVIRNKTVIYELYDNYKEILQEFEIYEENLEEIISNKKQMDNKLQKINLKIDISNETLQNTKEKQIKNGFLIEQKTKIQEIIRKLEDDYEEAQDVKCPVCRKFISKREFLQIHEYNHIELKEAQEELSKNRQEINEIDQKLKVLGEVKQKLYLLVKLHDTGIKKFEDKNTLDKEYNQLKKKEQEISRETEELKKSKKDEERERNKIQQNIKAIRAVKEFKKIMISEEFENNLKGSIIAEITLDAIDEVLKIQRNLSLDTLINKITEIWKVFFPKEEREIRFDADYKPYFEVQGEEIPYDEISAGEKMILLILIKTLLIKIYTKISFLILDEPLEHLNLENRIKIVDYLIELCEKDIIDQLIITTFEESLARKYFKSEERSINIISIPSIEKYGIEKKAE